MFSELCTAHHKPVLTFKALVNLTEVCRVVKGKVKRDGGRLNSGKAPETQQRPSIWSAGEETLDFSEFWMVKFEVSRTKSWWIVQITKYKFIHRSLSGFAKLQKPGSTLIMSSDSEELAHFNWQHNASPFGKLVYWAPTFGAPYH